MVDERTSENGFTEVLDRKEFHYQNQIDNYQKHIDDLKGIIDLTRKDIETIHKQNEDIEKNKEIIKEKSAQIAKMEEKDASLDKAIEILFRYEKALTYCIQNNQNQYLNLDSLHILKNEQAARLGKKEAELNSKEQQLEHAYGFEKFITIAKQL